MCAPSNWIEKPRHMGLKAPEKSMGRLGFLEMINHHELTSCPFPKWCKPELLRLLRLFNESIAVGQKTRIPTDLASPAYPRLLGHSWAPSKRPRCSPCSRLRVRSTGLARAFRPNVHEHSQFGAEVFVTNVTGVRAVSLNRDGFRTPPHIRS